MHDYQMWECEKCGIVWNVSVKNADKKYICPVCRNKKKGGEKNDGIRLGYHHGGDLRRS